MLARLALLALLAAPTQAAEPGRHHDRDHDWHTRWAPASDFGAIAYSTSTGNWGWSSGNTDLLSAQVAATHACGDGDCRPLAWEQGSCAALAVSDDDKTLWGSAGNWPNIEKADDIAIASCLQTGATRCSVATWTCN